jgi:thioredoxin-dependent peroxiredoxin
MALEVGDRFPAVTGTTHDGREVDLGDYAGSRNVVLYFYPRDLTPGCTREAGDFNRRLDDFAALDTEVIGMSVDPPNMHERFTTECGLNFPLLTDEKGRLSESLGILSEGGTARRTTFVIGKDGSLRHVFHVKSVDGHVDEVLDAVRAL